MTELLVDAGHPDEDHGDSGAVVSVAEHCEGGGRETLGFVDDEEFDPAG